MNTEEFILPAALGLVPRDASICQTTASPSNPPSTDDGDDTGGDGGDTDEPF